MRCQMCQGSGGSTVVDPQTGQPVPQPCPGCHGTGQG